MIVSVAVLLIGLGALALATWMSSRSDPDEAIQKVVWSLAQLMALLVVVFGIFLVYGSVTERNAPPVVDAQSSYAEPPASNVPSQPNFSDQTPTATLSIHVVSVETGISVPVANLAIQVEGKPTVQVQCDSGGNFALSRLPLGASVTIAAESHHHASAPKTIVMDAVAKSTQLEVHTDETPDVPSSTPAPAYPPSDTSTQKPGSEPDSTTIQPGISTPPPDDPGPGATTTAQRSLPRRLALSRHSNRSHGPFRPC